jgi:hypothetical protein
MSKQDTTKQQQLSSPKITIEELLKKHGIKKGSKKGAVLMPLSKSRGKDIQK